MHKDPHAPHLPVQPGGNVHKGLDKPTLLLHDKVAAELGRTATQDIVCYC